MTSAAGKTSDVTDVDRLHQIARLATALDLPRVQAEALFAAARLADAQFYVACVGQFKRGKSTLINALLDDRVLPVGIVPITAVPTVVRFGQRRTARVGVIGHQGNAAVAWTLIEPSDLEQYVSEEYNPGNARGVLVVEVLVPSPLLRDGMCLVDTPGIGSVFEANSAATRAFVPHIDAALIVIGADPPVTGDELDLIEDIGRQVDHLLVVLNKSDRVTDEERRVASEFAQTVISRRLRRAVGAVYEVSATERLAHVAPRRDWDRLEAELGSLSSTAGERLVVRATERTVDRIAHILGSVVRERSAAIRRPAEENQRRIEALERAVREGERALLDLDALFGVEQQRLSRQFSAARSEFLRAAIPHASRSLAESSLRIEARFGPLRRRELMRVAQSSARGVLNPWLESERKAAERVYRESMTRFVEWGGAFLARLAESEQAELTSLRDGLELTNRLDARSRFVFNEVITVAEPASPLRYAADVVLGAVAPETLEAEAQHYLEWLLEMNSARVESDVAQRVTESRRTLERDIRKLIRDVAVRAQRALTAANEVQAAGANAIQAELRRLEEIAAAVDEIAQSNVSRPPPNSDQSDHRQSR